jgi:hypothetical protein
LIDGIDKKCPCCDLTNLDHFKEMFDYYDEQAEKWFEHQNQTRDYRNEAQRREFQAKADVLGWVIERLEGRGGCL